MNNQLLNEKRLIGDEPGDNFIKKIFADPVQKLQLQQWLTHLTKNDQLNKLPENYYDQPVFKNSHFLPAWSDKKLMQQGAVFFARHSAAVLNLLGLLSLPYCYAAANGAMVLHLSERMRSDAEKRLYETAEFVWQVMDPDAFSADGSGFAAIAKVRLMHAAVRYYTLKSDQWNESFGFPINQEDMAGTNLSFSLIVIRGLRKFGYAISYQEQTAYIHLWNVIGCLIGLDDALLPANGKAANNLENAIRTRQFSPSEQGKSLTASLTGYFCKVNDGSIYTNADIHQLMRYLLGKEIAALLGIAGSDMSEGKISILKLKTFIEELTISKNSRQLYGEAFSRFKQLKPN
jgi:hypothetical protein